MLLVYGLFIAVKILFTTKASMYNDMHRHNKFKYKQINKNSEIIESTNIKLLRWT
jgi:hypothetical protein